MNIYAHFLSLPNDKKKQFLNSLKIVRYFKHIHNHSTSVCLLENQIVKKDIKTNKLGSFLFINEVNALKKLYPYEHFPKLLAYNTRNLSIYMSYCGECIHRNNIPKDWEYQINTIYKILSSIKVNSNDMILRNVCVLNEKIYIIDFGLCSPYGSSLEETMHKLKMDIKKLCPKNDLNKKRI